MPDVPTIPSPDASGSRRHRLSRRVVIAGAAGVATAGAFPLRGRLDARRSAAAAGSGAVQVLADVSLTSFANVISQAAARAMVPVTIDFQSRDALFDTVARADHPYDLIWPLSSYGLAAITPGRPLGQATTFASDPVVWGVRRSVADTLGWRNRTDLTAADLRDAITADKNPLRLVMNSPTRDDAAAAAWFGLLTAAAQPSSDALAAADLDRTEVTDLVTAITGRIGRMAPTADALSDAFVARSSQFDVLVGSARQIVAANWKLTGAYQEPLHIFYPVDAQTALDAPLIPVDGSSSLRAREAQAIIRQLNVTSLAFRQTISDWGWYPRSTYGLDQDPAIYVADWGISDAWNRHVLPIPAADVQREALTRYQQQWRKSSVTVLAIDRSGSMADHGNDAVQAALDAVLLQDQAAAHGLQAKPDDALVVFPFATEVGDPLIVHGNAPDDYRWLTGQIAGFPEGGGTTLFEMAVRGLWATEDQQPGDRLPAVIIVTDGEANMGKLDDVDNAFDDSPIGEVVPVYLVLTRMDDERRERAEGIAKRSAGAVIDGTDDLTSALRRARAGRARPTAYSSRVVRRSSGGGACRSARSSKGNTALSRQAAASSSGSMWIVVSIPGSSFAMICSSFPASACASPTGTVPGTSRWKSTNRWLPASRVRSA